MIVISSFIVLSLSFVCVLSAPNIESEIQSTVQQKTAEILKDISSQFQSSVTRHGQNDDPLHQIIGQQISDGMKGQFPFMPNHNLGMGMGMSQPQNPFPRPNFGPEQNLREQQPSRSIPLPLEMQRFHNTPLQQMLQDHLSPDQIVSELVREEQSRQQRPPGFPIQPPPPNPFPQNIQQPEPGLNLPQPFPQQGMQNPNFQNPQPQGPPLFAPSMQQSQAPMQMAWPNPIQQQRLPSAAQQNLPPIPPPPKPDVQIIQQIQNQISEMLHREQHPKLIPENYPKLQDIHSQLSAILQQANGNSPMSLSPDPEITQTHLPGPDFLSDLPDIVNTLSQLLLEDLQTPENKAPPALPHIQPEMAQEQQSLLQNIHNQLSELFRHNLQSSHSQGVPTLEHMDPGHAPLQPGIINGVESQGREEDKKLGLHILHQQIEEEEAKIQRKQDQKKQNHDHDWIIPKQKSGHRRNYAAYPDYDGE